MSKLKKQTIRDFLENLPLLECGGVISATEYARELIYEDYAPDFSSLGILDERFSTVPKGPISPEDSQRLGELEEQLEAAGEGDPLSLQCQPAEPAERVA
jgi:hypothetical protein